MRRCGGQPGGEELCRLAIPGRTPAAFPSGACGPPEPVLLEPSRTSPSSKGIAVAARLQSGRSSETPHLRGLLSAPPLPRAESRSFPRAPRGFGGGRARSTGPRLRAGLAGFQEEPRSGRRQQGAGALAPRRVRGRALPALRVDAGEDAERLPPPAGERKPRAGGGGGAGVRPQTHTERKKWVGGQRREVGPRFGRGDADRLPGRAPRSATRGQRSPEPGA